MRDKNVIFGMLNISSKHTDNRKMNILVLGKRPTDGLDNTKTTEAKYSVNINNLRKNLSTIQCCQQVFIC